MRTRSQFARVLVLTGLFAVLAVAPGLAATPSAAPLPGPAAAQAVPVADFLATLAAVPASTPATDCRISAGFCPAPQLCCLACGYFGCDTYACFNPVNGHCPLFP